MALKLRKQTGLKASISVAVGALFLAVLALVKADPGVKTQAQEQATVPNYDGIFAPGATATPQASQPITLPHTRSRAS